MMKSNSHYSDKGVSMSIEASHLQGQGHSKTPSNSSNSNNSTNPNNTTSSTQKPSNTGWWWFNSKSKK